MSGDVFFAIKFLSKKTMVSFIAKWDGSAIGKN